MQQAIQHNWMDAVLAAHPELRQNYEAYRQRKAEGKLEAWERVRLGEFVPGKVYDPVDVPEGARCELCGDVGYRTYWENGYQFAEECECFQRIQSEQAMNKAGVNREMTFENWSSDWDWQIDMGAKAVEYADGGYLSGQWFYAGGQVGCGKTHICTAIINEMTKKALGCRYMTWRDEAVQLKAIVNSNQAEYYERLQELKTVNILYIDDLFKTQQGQRPTQADVNLAFQIINHRYQDKKFVTIISCEYTTKQLMEIDEAVGSRIYERSKAYRVEIEKDRSKNYRLTMG